MCSLLLFKDNSPERDSFVVTPVPEVQGALEHTSETEDPSSSKQQQTHSDAKHAGKSKSPKIHAKNRQGRLVFFLAVLKPILNNIQII